MWEVPCGVGVHTHAHTCTHTHTHAYIHTHSHTYTCIRTHTLTHSHAHTYTYTHTHTHMGMICSCVCVFLEGLEVICHTSWDGSNRMLLATLGKEVWTRVFKLLLLPDVQVLLLCLDLLYSVTSPFNSPASPLILSVFKYVWEGVWLIWNQLLR